MTEAKRYAPRNIVAQGQTYLDHVAAMTREGLHAKSDIAAELAHRDLEIERLRNGLKFYAERCHFVWHDASVWDTVSGEPPNFWEDESNSATVEDGSIAQWILKGWSLPDDPQSEAMIPPDAPAPGGGAAGLTEKGS